MFLASENSSGSHFSLTRLECTEMYPTFRIEEFVVVVVTQKRRIHFHVFWKRLQWNNVIDNGDMPTFALGVL